MGTRGAPNAKPKPKSRFDMAYKQQRNMTDKYELTTLRDIFEKVPLHKIDECMRELTALIKECKTIEATMQNFAHVTTGDEGNAECVWPESVTWVDDSKGEVTASVIINDVHVATVHVKP